MVDAPNSPAADIIAGALPGILGRASVVVSPYPFGVSDGDSLRVVTCNSQTGVQIEIHGRAVPRGEVAKPFRLQHTPASNRTVLTQDFPMAGGFVTNVSVVAVAGTPVIGQTYVIVQMVRGQGAAAFVMGTLLSGYVTTTQALGWPGSPIVSSVEGEPVLRNIVGTQPAAGAEINETVPLNTRWELLNIFIRIVASGAGVTRFPNLQTTSLGQGFGLFLSDVGVDPGDTWLIQFAPNLPLIIYAGQRWAQSAIGQRVMLRAGDKITTATLNLDAGDQYNAPNYQVREWLEVG